MEGVGCRAAVEELLRLLDKCLLQMPWRLRSKSKRRLTLDIMSLCTGLRPAVMIDYGGKMPELPEQLYGLLCLVNKESEMLHSLRVVIIEEMVYLFHVKNILEHMHLSTSTRLPIQFVVLDQVPMKLGLPEQENSVMAEFSSIQKLLESFMSNHAQHMMDLSIEKLSFLNASDKAASINANTFSTKVDVQKGSGLSCKIPSLDTYSGGGSKLFDIIDLSQCMVGTRIAPPTLNGWLLGYPVVYLFEREHVAQAVSSLSIGSLHLFKILICSNVSFGKEDLEEELMSFSVPASLSSLGKNESWAKIFFMHMLEKVNRCKEVWRYIKLEVTTCNPISIAL